MSNIRQKNVVVNKSIIYGSVATYLGRKAEETKTHRWWIYVRGVDNEDLSYMLSKVVINLHTSFVNPVRVITEPPYVVSEYGWGEFETRIQLYFHDPLENPVDIIHLLVLYPPGNHSTSSKKPVVSEFYDELVFNEPTEFFHNKLMAGPEKIAPVLEFQEYLPNYSDASILKVLANAQSFIAKEIVDTKELLLHAEIETKDIKDRLLELTKEKKKRKEEKQITAGTNNRTSFDDEI